jgi:peptidoglycan/LPS O-acetylase OafA/YrhL
MASGRIKGLDGARAIAVLCVFLVHRTKQFSHTQIGHVAVEVFFALSGYLIVGILSEQRRAIEAGRGTLVGELTTFFQKRTFRIMPVYYLALAVICGLAAAGVVLEGFEWRQVPWHLFYVTNFLVARLGHWPALFGHFWSLAIEEQFYLLAAPVILLIPARRHMLICLAVIAAAYLSMVLQIFGAGLVIGGRSRLALEFRDHRPGRSRATHSTCCF